MALSFNSISYDDKKFIKRLDSKYYKLEKQLESFEETSEVSIDNFRTFILNITDGEHAGQTFVESGVLFLKNSSIKDYDISLNDGFYITEEKHKLLYRSALKPKDVLFTTIGHLGSAAIVPETFCEANMNQNFVKITIDETKINPYYITCFLNSKFARKQINALLTGNIQSILTYPKISNIKIIVPKDVEFQKNIENKYKRAIELSQKADELISSSLEILEESLNVKSYQCNKDKMFAVSDEDFYDKDSLWIPRYFLPEYTETEEFIKTNYDCVTLGEVVTMQKGDEPGSTYYTDYLNKMDTDVPFIRTSDLYNYQIDLSPDNFIDEMIYNDLNQDFQAGDILFTKDGKVGEMAIVTTSDKALYQSGIVRIRMNDYGIKKGLTQEYLFTAIMCDKIGKYNARRYTVTASTIPHLKEKNMQMMIIPIIEKERINKITTNIQKAFSFIEEKKNLINECQQMIEELCNRNFD